LSTVRTLPGTSFKLKLCLVQKDRRQPQSLFAPEPSVEKVPECREDRDEEEGLPDVQEEVAFPRFLRSVRIG
jgi:hypothetical protein